MNIATRAKDDLKWITAYWEDLAESRLPGTARPWRQTTLTPTQLAARDQAAYEERWERTIEALGASPAPVRIPVLDLLNDLMNDAYALAYHLAEASGEQAPEPPATPFSDPAPYIAAAQTHLDRLDDPEVVSWALDQTRSMVARVAASLALVYDGQRLDVECPWCRGVTPETPAGGARTWQVRDLLGGRACRHGLPDRRFCGACEQFVVIVCMGECEPPQKSVGTWWHGHPCWPVYEWDWLAKRIVQNA
ncbi:hypothetical protein [Streptosporangium sp. NPDC020145]|uniref:hypothetical protein n=1 Tax=Streptosporangium sp. NPDC020145 TaxID=3154694 RepID=UPI003419BD62